MITTTKLAIPQRIGRLDELAHNLWWCWHDDARRLFRALDHRLWRMTGHNPVKMLRDISPDELQMAAIDPNFLRLYDGVITAFDREMSASDTWFATTHPGQLTNHLAYFSMEYAIHYSLPIYAGGLGVLAGDICKEASDLGLPTVAIGFMYPQGYFHQHVCLNYANCQEEVYRQLDFEEAPIAKLLSPNGESPPISMEICGDRIDVAVWQVKVGRTNVYLLDTSLETNPPQYRQLSARLYVADQEIRMQQEIVLGIGGVRVLRALGINPEIWHGNEGHTAFMMLERLREEVAKGTSPTEAANKVRQTTVFTTHTPVMAGHDIFPPALVEKYFKDYWKDLGLDRDKFFQLGRMDGAGFNMTALALRLSNHRFGVSQVHGEVTRRMWHGLWPELPESRVPLTHITNGVHVPSWIAPELCELFDKYLGKDWLARHDDKKLWERIFDIPDNEFWWVHLQLKRKLISVMRESGRERWIENDVPLKEMPTMGVMLDPDALTIGFARRFAEYKRPTLLFRDTQRLRRILTNRWRPVQVIFAGKSHPADFASKMLLKQVYTQAIDSSYEGRIGFLEDYDLHYARYMVQGVDVWLNNPRRQQEACGTSGMKAALNGAIHLSVRDGWWHEACTGTNGWAIGPETIRPEDEDAIDADSLYRLLEEEIVPLYYTRDRNGVPHGWVHMMKESARSIVPVYCARRMVKEYNERMYLPASRAAK